MSFLEILISTIIVCNNEAHPQVSSCSLDTADAPERIFFSFYSVWKQGQFMCSSVSRAEYAMSFTDFLLAYLLRSNPDVLPLWTISSWDIQQHRWNCHWGQRNTPAEMRFDWKPWIPEITIWSLYLQPLRDLNEMGMTWLWSPAGG